MVRDFNQMTTVRVTKDDQETLQTFPGKNDAERFGYMIDRLHRFEEMNKSILVKITAPTLKKHIGEDLYNRLMEPV